jgi:hypothetical protein
MPFRSRVDKLLEHLYGCEDDNRAAELARELKRALHEEIELMRTKTKSLSVINATTVRPN